MLTQLRASEQIEERRILLLHRQNDLSPRRSSCSSAAESSVLLRQKQTGWLLGSVRTRDARKAAELPHASSVVNHNQRNGCGELTH